MQCGVERVANAVPDADSAWDQRSEQRAKPIAAGLEVEPRADGRRRDGGAHTARTSGRVQQDPQGARHVRVRANEQTGFTRTGSAEEPQVRPLRYLDAR